MVLKLWTREMMLVEMLEHSWVHGWSFFDGEPIEPEPTEHEQAQTEVPLIRPFVRSNTHPPLIAPPTAPLVRAVSHQLPRHSMHVNMETFLFSAKTHQCRTVG